MVILAKFWVGTNRFCYLLMYHQVSTQADQKPADMPLLFSQGSSDTPVMMTAGGTR